VKDLALAAGATFYADPFTPQHGSHDDDGIVSRAMTWLSAVVPLPRPAGEGQDRMLPKPQARLREEPRERVGRPPQRYAPPPMPYRASGASYRRMPAGGVAAE
jgi:hypothetical protein